MADAEKIKQEIQLGVLEVLNKDLEEIGTIIDNLEMKYEILENKMIKKRRKKIIKKDESFDIVSTLKRKIDEIENEMNDIIKEKKIKMIEEEKNYSIQHEILKKFDLKDNDITFYLENNLDEIQKYYFPLTKK